MSNESPIRVFVGSDRSQQLAVDVLAHSIRRHTDATVEVVPMIDLDMPTPKDPRQGQRTGFSFARFCIPALAGYRGKAIYMDADMQVFRDIRELWNIPFDGCKVVIQEDVKHNETSTAKEGAPQSRIKQCSVMLLDCEALDWKIDTIIAGLDQGSYDYEELMYHLCILEEDEVKYGVPYEWNSLEHWDQGTCLLHYTDMYTQPWVSVRNPLGRIWFEEVRAMLADGSLTLPQLEHEIAEGYFRPSLIADVKWRHHVPSYLRPLFDRWLERKDSAAGFVKHKAVYDAKRTRKKLIKAYEAELAEKAARTESGDPSAGAGHSADGA